MDNREQWIATNISDRSISLGLSNIRVLRPGRSTDLLATLQKEDVIQSPSIANLLDLQWITIERIVDGASVGVISSRSDLQSVVSTDLANQKIETSGSNVSLAVTIDTKADILDVYTRVETDILLYTKPDCEDVYTKEEVVALLAALEAKLRAEFKP